MIVAVTYAAELVREARVGRFPYEALPVQVALASLVVLLLLVAAMGLHQQTLLGGTTRRMRHLVFWVPRIALLAFVAFIGLFALDVFGAGFGHSETLLALAIHLLPAITLLAAAGLASRRS
jgi:hypothetical protein